MNKPWRVCAILTAINLSGLMVLLGGCDQGVRPSLPPTVVISGCEHFHLITASPADTVPTKTQILAHNAEYLKTCRKPSEK